MALLPSPPSSLRADESAADEQRQHSSGDHAQPSAGSQHRQTASCALPDSFRHRPPVHGTLASDIPFHWSSTQLASRRLAQRAASGSILSVLSVLSVLSALSALSALSVRLGADGWRFFSSRRKQRTRAPAPRSNRGSNQQAARREGSVVRRSGPRYASAILTESGSSAPARAVLTCTHPWQLHTTSACHVRHRWSNPRLAPERG